VIANSGDPEAYVFKVESETKNGWLRCSPYSNQSGDPAPSAEDEPPRIFWFRISCMRKYSVQT
jgi:hypothetical protein